METVALNENELPSAARRRLSVVLAADGEESAAALALRRSTVSFAGVAHGHLEKILQEEEGDDQEGPTSTSQQPQQQQQQQLPSRRDNRASVVGRRASAFSRVFALSSTSESFMEGNIRPTLINAMIFLSDPKPDVNKIRQVLADRLLCIPRFRSVVKMDDKSRVHFDPLPRDAVDFRQHIKLVDGRGKYDAEDIEELVTDSFLTDWPSDRPLWRGTLVTNLADGRSLLFIVIDHAIGDGVGLLAVLLSLFDDPADTDGGAAADKSETKTEKLQQKRKTTPSLRWSHRIVAFLGGMYDGIINTLVPPPCDNPSSITIPKEQLEYPCPGKTLAQTRGFPIDEVKSIKNKLAGATVNDIILALIAVAVRKSFEKTGDEALDVILKGKGKVRADFPVNMRTGKAEGGAGLGNEFVLGTFRFPIKHSDPIDAVWQCKSRVDEIKVSPAFHLKKVLSDAIFGNAPDTVLSAKILHAMNQSTCMVSNVIGPSQEAALGGYDISDLNFTTAYVGGLYFGVLTFKGNLRISAILDKRCSGDVEVIRDSLEEAYDDLRDALKDVDEDCPLRQPDMTPLAARILEGVVYIAAVALPVLVAMQFQK